MCRRLELVDAQRLGEIEGNQEYQRAVGHPAHRRYGKDGPHSSAAEGVFHPRPVGGDAGADIHIFGALAAGVAEEDENQHGGDEHNRSATGQHPAPADRFPRQLPGDSDPGVAAAAAPGQGSQHQGAGGHRPQHIADTAGGAVHGDEQPAPFRETTGQQPQGRRVPEGAAHRAQRQSAEDEGVRGGDGHQQVAQANHQGADGQYPGDAVVKDVHEEAAGSTSDAAKDGTDGDDGTHLERAQSQVGSDDRGQQGDAVGVEVLEGVGADEGGRHHRAFGAGYAATAWRAGSAGGGGSANCCLRHRAYSFAVGAPGRTGAGGGR